MLPLEACHIHRVDQRHIRLFLRNIRHNRVDGGSPLSYLLEPLELPPGITDLPLKLRDVDLPAVRLGDPAVVLDPLLARELLLGDTLVDIVGRVAVRRATAFGCLVELLLCLLLLSDIAVATTVAI